MLAGAGVHLFALFVLPASTPDGQLQLYSASLHIPNGGTHNARNTGTEPAAPFSTGHRRSLIP
jgi:hypothetical protein